MTVFTRLAAIALTAIAAPSLAATVVDQSQVNTPVYMAGFSQGSLAQSFTAGATNISGGGVYLEFTPGSSFTVSFGLYNALPNAGGTLLASGTGTVTVGQNWVDAFWAPVAATVGTQYFLTFDSTSNNGVAGDTSNPYAGGQVYANGGYGSYPSFDYTFRTYTDNGVGGVPEPTSWMLMVGGFGLVGAAARRRGRIVAA